jgi:hypothetical protein
MGIKFFFDLFKYLLIIVNFKFEFKKVSVAINI